MYGTVCTVVCDKAVILLAGCIFLPLVYYSMRYTELIIEGTETRQTYKDSVFWNLLAVLCVIGTAIVLRLLSDKSGTKRFVKMIMYASYIYIAGMGIFWINIVLAKPLADAEALCKIASLFLNGEYGTMLPPGYMSYTPHQYGIVFILQILFQLFGDGNYIAFEYQSGIEVGTGIPYAS